MHITTIALVISIVGLLSSFVLVGFIPSLISLALGIRLLIEDKTIEVVRIVAISFVGVILPIIMYFNTYGISFPKDNDSKENTFVHIIAENYENLGLYNRKDGEITEETPAAELVYQPVEEKEADYEIYHVSSGIPADAEAANSADEASSQDLPDIFESLDSINKDDAGNGEVVNVAASDDDMPSYGGLPVGTMLVAQYFREDDHNCNPVLVLRNETGDVCRYECIFTARDRDGNDLATSEKTVEVVRDKGSFVFEGRFDKRQLGNAVPDSYEFLVSKRTPYEKDMSAEVEVYTGISDSYAVLTANNKSSSRVKVDAYVLFFDGSELVDCMWMIPQNTGEVCIEAGSSASIQGNSYYRFDRVETYYTAYEAVGG